VSETYYLAGTKCTVNI